ncbi:DUF29 family protein [Sinorhizobium medicae]|uniref:DUF29 family protein n=1 Tax=Sinorhizobium medicae TaxID=110321 RepID=UPI002AF6B526|nr:DUF29 family protein [Sinorhizobium medicae]WQO72194.1 DUF29 family protein [Sinorhizobium medicae]
MTLYDDDFVRWTQQQAAFFRSMPASEGLDIEHLVDEIEGLGRSAIADLSSAIRHLLTRLVNRSVDPSSVSIEDIYSAQSEAIISADAGVWRHVDLDQVWRLVKRSTDVELYDRCPIAIDQLLAVDFDEHRAVALIVAGPAR